SRKRRFPGFPVNFFKFVGFGLLPRISYFGGGENLAPTRSLIRRSGGFVPPLPALPRRLATEPAILLRRLPRVARGAQAAQVLRSVRSACPPRNNVVHMDARCLSALAADRLRRDDRCARPAPLSAVSSARCRRSCISALMYRAESFSGQRSAPWMRTWSDRA